MNASGILSRRISHIRTRRSVVRAKIFDEDQSAAFRFRLYFGSDQLRKSETMFSESAYLTLVIVAFVSFIASLGFVSWWSSRK